jgi:hypothetical protein
MPPPRQSNGVASTDSGKIPPHLATTRPQGSKTKGEQNADSDHHSRWNNSNRNNHRNVIAMATRSIRRTDQRSSAIRKQTIEDKEGAGKMKYREPLFSVHGNEGRLAIYLEGRDAVLDLIEETGREVHPDYIADLADYGEVQNLKTEEGFDKYSKHRNKLDETVLLIASMSHEEALTLAQQILITAREFREPRRPRLEIVK